MVSRASGVTLGGMPGRAPRRARRRAFRAAAAGITLMVAAVLALASSGIAQATGSQLVSESFKNNTTTRQEYQVGGTNFMPCLTAMGGTTGTPTSCVGTLDTNTHGTLRLTDTTLYTGSGEAGYLLFNHALPTRGGLDIHFTQFQWGGSPEADGISFFLTDGAYDLTSVGPVGGSLGYNARSDTSPFGTSQPVTPGLAHALLGVGLDEYGNFPSETNDPGCPAVTGYAPVRNTKVPSAITVRGPAGNVVTNGGTLTGYCLLGAPVTVSGMGSPGATSRPAGTQVEIIVDPPSDTAHYPTPMVHVFWGGTEVLTVPEPSVFRTSTTFKFGFAASTGNSVDNHEINQFSLQTVNVLPPGLSVSSPSSEPSVPAGATSIVPVTVTVDSDYGPATAPFTTTVSLSSGTFAGTPTGTRWSCPTPSSGATSVVCAYTPNSMNPDFPSTVLPVLSVPVTNATSGNVNVTSTLSPNADTVNTTATTVVPFTPIASPGTVTVPSGASASTVFPIPLGTGPFTRQIVGPLPTGITSATIDQTTGVLTVGAASTYSGPATLQYTATDAAGNVSAPSTIAVTVTPSLAPIPTVTVTAVAAGRTPPTATATAVGLGTGPFGYTLTSSPAASAGTATIDPATGALTFTPVAGFSGKVDVSVTATDAHGTAVTGVWHVHVVPVADPSAAGGSQRGLAGVTQTFTPPTPIGVGPFSYHVASVTPTSDGAVTIDPTTGAMTFVPRRGFVGEVAAEYFVVDASGLSSASVSVTFRVVPSGALAFTGGNVGWMIGAGVLALILGFFFVAGLRERRAR